MKLGFYPGCSLEGMSREYSDSVVALAKRFDIELVQIPDWNCCGATAAHNLNKELALSLPARNLALAEKEGFTDVVVPCAACYSRFSTTHHELMHNHDLRHKINEVMGMEYKGTINTLNVIQFIDKYIIDKIEEKIVKKFDYKAACYYGCLLVRPNNILGFDRTEDPQTMDVVMRKIGADSIDWAFKTECCGAGLSVSATNTVARLSGKIVEDADHRGAEVIIVACPMCHSNLDMRRSEINKYLGKKITTPILYITQALGLAVGISEKELGFNRHFVPVKLPKKAEIEKKAEVKTQIEEVNNG